MNFKELWQKLEASLGYHQVPMNAAAHGVKDIFEGSPLHHELMVRLAQAIYKQNTCRKITDPVSEAATFEALTPIRLEVLRSATTDVDLYRFVEELCVAIRSAFHETPGVAAAPTQDPRPTADVIKIDRFRPRRRLKTSA